MELIKDEITVILTVWKRDHVEEQIECLLHQTKKPYKILIYQNESHIDIPEYIRKKNNIDLIHSRDHNYKFHGRFTIPLLCDTEYVAIFDDDTMPGKRWLEHCMKVSKENNCIVGANGRTLLDKSFLTNKTLDSGGGLCSDYETEVDFVGHCWFFKTEWCKYLWYDRPATWDNGEDIHLSAACYIHAGIRSFVPSQPWNQPELYGDLKNHYGCDEHATWKTNTHEDIRLKVINYWREKGWKPLIERENCLP